MAVFVSFYYMFVLFIVCRSQNTSSVFPGSGDDETSIFLLPTVTSSFSSSTTSVATSNPSISVIINA